MKIATPIIVIITLLMEAQNSAAHSIGAPEDNSTSTEKPHNLKVLSWNIYMLPKMVARPGKKQRANAIVEELKKSDFDIIVFQEAFLPAARKIIAGGLDSLYPYQYGPVNDEPGIKTSSGVWIISKVEMKVLKTIEFKECASWDCLARKGAVLLEGTFNGKDFQLLGTHLQSDNYQEIRYKQMDAIYNQLLLDNRRDGVPQLVCGDMNTEAEINERYCEMLNCFQAENGEISGIEKCTYDGANNEIAKYVGGKDRKTFDYILVRNNGARFKSIQRFVSVLKKGTRHLSDHYGIVCELTF